MAHYKVSFRINGTAYYTEGESSYPSDEAIKGRGINMDIAMENAAMFASAYKNMSHLEGKIDPNSISFEVYK